MEITTTTTPMPLGFQLLIWAMANVLGWVSTVIADINFGTVAELIFLWTFRGLSLLSLILIIAMNWDKGMKKINVWKEKIFGK